MRLLVSAARRSSVGLLMAGFLAGIVLTMTVLSVMRDGSHVHEFQQLGASDPHQHQHRRRHRHDHSGDADAHGDDMKVIDLAEQDRHKHKGLSSCCVVQWRPLAAPRGGAAAPRP